MKRKTITTAEILCVGTELLLGDIINTNAAYVAGKLAELGINLYHESVVGDNETRLRGAVELALSRSDLVILSGGLGPTYDDMTKEVVADCLGLALYEDEASLRQIELYFAKNGRVMTENNKKQALIPEGATILTNNNGTAPGILIEPDESKAVILLPGPPRELTAMFEESVIPYLRGRTEHVLHSVHIHLTGIGESAAESHLRERMLAATNPTIAPYAGEGEVRLRVTAKAATRAEAEAMCRDEVERIKETSVGDYIYGVDVSSIEEALVRALSREGKTIAVAESCTGGLIAKRITDVAGASAVFLGGCVTYANEAKVKLIGVRPDTLSAHGAVSEEVAREMARGVRLTLGADIGLATTGIAGPGGGSEEKPVGTVYVALSNDEGERVVCLSLSSMRSRSYIRTVASTRAMALALGLPV